MVERIDALVHLARLRPVFTRGVIWTHVTQRDPPLWWRARRLSSLEAFAFLKSGNVQGPSFGAHGSWQSSRERRHV